MNISVEEEPPTKVAKFSPFSGSSRRLDGKPLTEPATLPVSPLRKQHNGNVGNVTVASKSSSSNSHQHSGKLVFGSNGNQTPRETTKVCFAISFFFCELSMFCYINLMMEVIQIIHIHI